MQKMCDGVMPLNGASARGVDAHDDTFTGRGGCFPHHRFDEVQPNVAGFLRIENVPELASAAHFPRVPDLTTHFRVAGRSVENHGVFLFDADYIKDVRFGLKLVVADEPRRSRSVDVGNTDDFPSLRRTP